MKLSLAKISFLNILFTALVFTVVIGLFTAKITNDSYEKRVNYLEKSYIQKNKKLVKNEVTRIINRISTLEELSSLTLKNSLIEKVNFIHNMLKSNDYNSLSKNESISLCKENLSHFKGDENIGYVYIFDINGKIFYDESNNGYKNKNIFEIAKKNKELENFLKDTIKKDKNFDNSKWYKPNSKIDESYNRYIYSIKPENLNIYIVAGIYKTELDKKVQNLLFQELEKDRFGEKNYGYFWIHDLNNKLVMHPTRKDLVNKDLTDFLTLDGQFFFQNASKLVQEENSGFINYIWYRPNSDLQDKKISYVQLIKNWDMVIGSGFYLGELSDMLRDENNKLKQSLTDNLRKILTILAVLIIISLLLAKLVATKIQAMEDSQKEYMNMLEQYQLILDKSAVVSKTDKQGIITYVNDSFVKVSKYTKDEIIGKSHNIVRHPETPKSQFKKLWATIQKGEIWKGILKNKNKYGESYFNNVTIVPIKDSQGNIIEYISSGMDVTELFENRTKMQNIFKTDALTGLRNRVSLIDDITNNFTGALALINIDRFKEINDIQGHETGDSIIKELGLRLFNFISNEQHNVYRVHADIFAVFSVHGPQEELVNKIEEFINTIGKKPYKYNKNNFILTYTAGVASNNKDLFAYADMALSEAKNKKIKIKEYDSSMNNIKEFKQNIIWVEKLHIALAEDRIVPYYQPIYNYKTQKIEKYECLMRLIEDDKVIPPGEYLDVAKKTKLYPELTYKMAAKAISKFATLEEEFSINLSIEDLMNPELMAFIYDYAEQKEVFQRLVLEIVESEEISDSDSITKTIKRFKDKGTKIAIDDFGCGYSNYEYLISLHANYIKIDGSIISLVLEDERTAEVVRSIVTFAQKSNMKTIAEFVSSKELDEKVRSLGVDFAQGYYYGKAEKEIITS